MGNRTIRLLAVFLVLLLAALLILGYTAGQRYPRGLLLAEPLAQGSGLDPDRIEQFCQDRFLVTYEIRQNKSVRALGAGHTVTLIGTNSHYRDILGYAVLDGGFFTAAAQSMQQRYAVCNEAAAFALFGGGRVSGNEIIIDGASWTVTGVIRDMDESPNLYAPGSVTGGRPQAVMAPLNTNELTEAAVVNALKDLGLQSTNTDLINLSRTAAAFWERFTVAWQIAACLLILFLGGGQIQRLRRRIRAFRRKLRRMYFRQAVAHSPKDFAVMTGTLALLAAGVGAVLLLFLRILSTCLGWQQLRPPAGTAGLNEFASLTAGLQAHQTWSVVLFFVFLSILALFILCMIRQRIISIDSANEEEEPES